MRWSTFDFDVSRSFYEPVRNGSQVNISGVIRGWVWKGLSYTFPIDLRRLNQCAPSQFWRASVAAGSILGWSQWTVCECDQPPSWHEAGTDMLSVGRVFGTMSADVRCSFHRTYTIRPYRTTVQLTGIWAGTMGHTQFIPTSYQSFAVDFTGDGRRDVWSEDPFDALASTARFLARNGWCSGLKWRAEFGTGGPQGRTIQPQREGVKFTVTHNFDVLKTYNNFDFYAIGVGHLADRISCAGPLQGSFPPDPNGLTKEDRLAVQRGSAARGYDVGTIDGVIGAKTEVAIRDFQQR